MALDTSADSPVPVRTVLQLVGGGIGKLGRGWVEDAGEVGIDHLLVRGAELAWPATRWLPERRDVHLNGSLPLRLSADRDPMCLC